MALCDTFRRPPAAPSPVLVLFTTILIAQSAIATNPFTCYANDFVDPVYATAGRYASYLKGAQDTVIAWAEEMNAHGPWSVTNKPVVAPSGNKHDYMSWAPYQWPDCSSVGNKTALSPAQVRKTCPYVFRDGQVNPDRSIPNDFQSFFNLSDAILYNALAFTFQNESSSVYSQNVAKYIKTWFLDSNTSMNPNLNYAQMNLGPQGQSGEYTGILDLRMFAKIASGILIIRTRGSADWTPEIDSGFVAWCKKYIAWLQTASTAKQAAASKNNHGTYYVNQLMSLMLLVNDTAGATKLGRGYFGGIYKGQIASDGNQPMEATRSRPYHYRNFNIAGMITNARLLKHADPTSNDWNTTSSGATIQTAVDFLMATNPGATHETNVTAEIYPNVEAIAATYGDPQGKYGRFLNASGFPYMDDASFLWDQPLSRVLKAGSGGVGPGTQPSSGPDDPVGTISPGPSTSSNGAVPSTSLNGAVPSTSLNGAVPPTGSSGAAPVRPVHAFTVLNGLLLVLGWRL